jgi:hypothetical protein
MSTIQQSACPVCDGRGFVALVPEAEVMPTRKRRPPRFRLGARRVASASRADIAKACWQISHEEWRENLQGKLYWLAARAIGVGEGDRNDIAWLSENLDNHVEAIRKDGRTSMWRTLPARVDALADALRVAIIVEAS